MVSLFIGFILFYQWNDELIREQIIDDAEWNAQINIFLKHTNGKWKMAQSFAFMLVLCLNISKRSI